MGSTVPHRDGVSEESPTEASFGRIAVYLNYFPNGIVRRHTLYYLEALVKNCDQVLVVVDGDINDEGKDQILSLTQNLLIRKNEGFDIWGYKEGMEWFGWERIRKCRELLLTNGTCYGPVYPLEEVFSAMEQRECDFWELVKHPHQDSDLMPDHRGHINEHIMSDFTVIRHKMLNSPCLKKYWDSLTRLTRKEEAVGLHEVVFTKYFEERGFKADAYVDLAKYEGRVNNSSIFLADELLMQDRCPLVKRRAFVFPNYQDLRGHMMTDRAGRLFEFIRTQTDYDVSMIWEDLLANERLSLIRQNMHLTKAITENWTHAQLPDDKKISAVVYVPDHANARIYAGLIHTLEQIGAKTAVYYTSDRIGRQLADSVVAPHERLAVVKLTNCQGIDVIYKCLELSMENLLQADYVFAMLYVDEIDGKLNIDYEDMHRCLIENLAGSGERIASILQMLEGDPYLGMIDAFPSSFGGYFARNQFLISDRWDHLRRIHEACGFTFAFDEDVDLSECAFWTNQKGFAAIVNMLKTLAEADGNIAVDMPELKYLLPRFVQAGGMYTLRVISDELANVELDNLRYDAQRMKQALRTEGISNWDVYNTLMGINGSVDGNAIGALDRSTIVNGPFKLREIVKIALHYPKYKLKSMLGEERTRKLKRWLKREPRTRQLVFCAHASLMNITLEDGRALFLFSSSEVDFNRCKLVCGEKKSYALKRLKENQWDTIDYCRAAGRYAAFFSVPVDWVRNSRIQLMFEDNQTIGVQWVFAVSYNALELKNLDLYFRIENKILYCQSKKGFIFQVMKSHAYTLKEKMVFAFTCVNRYHPLTIMAENLNAGDNTYQLFQYALQKKEPVYFVCSQKTYDSQRSEELRRHMLIHNSRKHKLAMLFAQRWVGSYSLRAELLPTAGVLKDIHFCMLPAHWIFIPHGVTLPDKTAFMCICYNWENPERTYTVATAERDTFAGYYGFKNVYALGAPRMDKWANIRNSNDDVLFFFTWRQNWAKYQKENEENQFADSEYFNIAVEAVKTVRKAFPDRKISYVFHHEVERRALDKPICKALKEDNVTFIRFSDSNGEEAFNDAFRNARYLITDFSSVAYDFSYKPDGIAVYYQPEKFIQGYYEVDQSCFEQIHLGIVAGTSDELVRCLNMKQRTKEMEDRRKRFFPNLNGGNTERVYEAIFHSDHDQLTLPSLKNTEKRSPQKRLCIYFFYDEDGIVDRYVTHYLREMRKCCGEICVVVNGKLTEEGRHKLQAVCDALIVRENVGFDSAAYKEAILHYGYERIADEYDEVVLNNCTNFGPVYPIEDMFSDMEARDCDIWGNGYYSAAGHRMGSVVIPDHLMSYFIVFRSAILKSRAFAEYWETLKLADNYQEAVIFHELRCMEYFMRKGFAAESFIPREKYLNKNNIAVWQAYRLLTEDKNPLLKRKVFFMDEQGFSFKLQDGHDACEIMEYLVDNTDYDPMLIMENIGRMRIPSEEMTVSEYASIHEDFAYNKLLRIAQKRVDEKND